MPFCKFCIYADFYKRDKYNCVLCTENNKYYYRAEQLNHCSIFKPTDCASYNIDYELKKADEKADVKNHNSNDCFITTTVCDILKYDDNCLSLNLLRKLRDKFMIGNDKYTNLLIEYYLIGPIISKNLLSEQKKEEVANDLYQTYILVACELIINKQFEKAIEQYTKMVNFLKKKYQISNFKIQYDQNIKCNSKNDFKKIVKTIK